MIKPAASHQDASRRISTPTEGPSRRRASASLSGAAAPAAVTEQMANVCGAHACHHRLH